LSTLLRDGPLLLLLLLFFGGGGEVLRWGGVGQFPKRNSCTAKTALKKWCKGSHRVKSRHGFYYPGLIFGAVAPDLVLKKFLDKLFPIKKRKR